MINHHAWELRQSTPCNWMKCSGSKDHRQSLAALSRYFGGGSLTFRESAPRRISPDNQASGHSQRLALRALGTLGAYGRWAVGMLSYACLLGVLDWIVEAFVRANLSCLIVFLF